MSQHLGRTTADAHKEGPADNLARLPNHQRQHAEQDICEQSKADLSYELRTTLAIITLVSGNLDLLYDRLDDEQRQKMIRDIRKYTQRMNDFIADVLELCNSYGVVVL